MFRSWLGSPSPKEIVGKSVDLKVVVFRLALPIKALPYQAMSIPWSDVERFVVPQWC